MTGSLVQELRRRNVFRVAAIYVVVSWLLMQIGDVMFPALRLPDWTTTLLVAFILLGFPLALIFAWAFELTPEGVVRTSEVPVEQSITAATGQKINYMIIGLLTVAIVFLLAKDLLQPDTPAPTAVTTDQSIAVLPFKNQSASSENAEFFSGGLHDELLTLLSRLDDLKVISRTSVERLDPKLSIREIGALLGVATILEGQVQRAGDRLRINVQLIDTAEEGHLWANTYDSELTAENVFEVQGDIARKIANELHAELSPDEEQLLAAVPTTSTAALEKYLLGAQLAKRQSFDALEDAIGYLEEATTLDPGYAEAWVALAAALSSAFQTGALSRKEYVPALERSVRNALTLNPRLSAGHAQQALLQWTLGDLEGAETSFRQAIELDPDNALAIGEYAYFLRENFRAEEAIPLLEQALPNDPLSTGLLFELGKNEMHSGHPERFAEIAERIREIDPAVIGGYTGTMQAYLWQGRIDLALPWFLKTFEVDPLDHENWAHTGLFLVQLGDIVLGERYLQRAIELAPDKPAVLKCRVQILQARGEHEAALAISRQALNASLRDRWGSDIIFLRTVRDAALDSGNIDDILGLYRDRAPEVFGPERIVTFATRWYAIDAILLLRRTGEYEQADRIVKTALELYERINPQRIRGYDTSIMDVHLLALAGEHDLAIERLQQAFDAGWFFQWEHLVDNRNLDSLRERPEFQAIVAQFERKNAEQRGNWRALPDMGEFDLRN